MSKNAYLLLAALALTATQLHAGDCSPKPEQPKCVYAVVKQDSCCQKKHKCKKKCVRVEDTKKHTETCYRCKEKEICLPGCYFCHLAKCGGCKDCGDGKCDHCGKPRTVRKLCKRFVVEEKCTTKCVVVDDDCCHGQQGPTFYTPAIVSEPIKTPAKGGPEALPIAPMEVKPKKN